MNIHAKYTQNAKIFSKHPETNNFYLGKISISSFYSKPELSILWDHYSDKYLNYPDFAIQHLEKNNHFKTVA